MFLRVSENGVWDGRRQKSYSSGVLHKYYQLEISLCLIFCGDRWLQFCYHTCPVLECLPLLVAV